MAGSPLTWRNVEAPDLRGAFTGLQIANTAFDRAFTGLNAGLDKFQDYRKDAAESQVLNAAMAYQDPASLRAAIADGRVFAGADRSLLGRQALTALNGQAGQLLSQAVQQQGLNTARVQDPINTELLGTRLERGRYDLAFDQSTEGLRRGKLAADLDSTQVQTAGARTRNAFDIDSYGDRLDQGRLGNLNSRIGIAGRVNELGEAENRRADTEFASSAVERIVRESNGDPNRAAAMFTSLSGGSGAARAMVFAELNRRGAWTPEAAAKLDPNQELATPGRGPDAPRPRATVDSVLGAAGLAPLSSVVHGLESSGRMTPGIRGDGGRAAGPMQVHQGALTDFNRANGTNISHDALASNPELGKRVGDWYLGEMVRQFGSPERGLGAYNQGPGAMRTAIERAAREGGDPISYLPNNGSRYVAEGMRALGRTNPNANVRNVGGPAIAQAAGLPVGNGDGAPITAPAPGRNAARVDALLVEQDRQRLALDNSPAAPVVAAALPTSPPTAASTAGAAPNEILALTPQQGAARVQQINRQAASIITQLQRGAAQDNSGFIANYDKNLTSEATPAAVVTDLAKNGALGGMSEPEIRNQLIQIREATPPGQPVPTWAQAGAVLSESVGGAQAAWFSREGLLGGATVFNINEPRYRTEVLPEMIQRNLALIHSQDAATARDTNTARTQRIEEITNAQKSIETLQAQLATAKAQGNVNGRAPENNPEAVRIARRISEAESKLAGLLQEGSRRENGPRYQNGLNANGVPVPTPGQRTPPRPVTARERALMDRMLSDDDGMR